MYWVIEPHVDDAYLSLHEHMKIWIKEDKRVSILTVFSTPQRNREGEEYASLIGADYHSLMVEEGMKGLRGNSVSLPPVNKWGVKFKKGHKLIFPIGLQHPDHKEVANCAPSSAWRYFDTPYQAKLKIGDELRYLSRYTYLVSILYPSARKGRVCEIFKSQSKFFYYNPPESFSKIPEVIVKHA